MFGTHNDTDQDRFLARTLPLLQLPLQLLQLLRLVNHYYYDDHNTTTTPLDWSLAAAATTATTTLLPLLLYFPLLLPLLYSTQLHSTLLQKTVRNSTTTTATTFQHSDSSSNSNPNFNFNYARDTACSERCHVSLDALCWPTASERTGFTRGRDPLDALLSQLTAAYMVVVSQTAAEASQKSVFSGLCLPVCEPGLLPTHRAYGCHRKLVTVIATLHTWSTGHACTQTYVAGTRPSERLKRRPRPRPWELPHPTAPCISMAIWAPCLRYQSQALRGRRPARGIILAAPFFLPCSITPRTAATTIRYSSSTRCGQ